VSQRQPSPLIPSASVSPMLDAMLQTFTPGQSVLVTAADGGARTEVLPVMVADAHAGHHLRGFRQDWYDTVHVLPRSIDAGNITGDQSHSVLFWSAYLYPVQMGPLETTGDMEGIALEGGPEGPYLWRATEYAEYQLTITAAGPVIIDAAILWPMQDADDGMLVITGQRLVMIPFAPDWSQAVEERLGWLTDVQRAWSGAEQRVRLREAPRRTMRYRLLLTADQARELEGLMWSWQDRPFGVPLWRDPSRLTAAAAAEALTLALPTDDREFVSGGNAVLWAGPEATETVSIESVAAGELTLQRPLVGDWPAGTLVYPLVTGRIRAETTIGRPTADITEGTLEVELDQPLAVVEDGTPAQTFEGVELWLRAPNRASTMQITYGRTMDRHDGGVGRWTEAAREDRPYIVRGHEHIGLDRADMRELFRFLHRRAGRWASAWVPTWNLDLRVVADVLAADIEITVHAVQYQGRYDGHPGRDAVLLRHLPSDTWIARRVVGASDDGAATQTLVLGAAVGIDGTAEHWRVYWLERARLESDEVSVRWPAAEVGLVDMALRRVDA
jgi:hypothetical protein